jgi:DNA repair/transcription protein MET18/MMS19
MFRVGTLSDRVYIEMLANKIIALDLGVYKLPNLLIDMGHYLNQDSDLITVARGMLK